MARLRFWSLFLLVLLVAVSVVSVRAGAWSEVVYTKPWTEEEQEEDTVEEKPVVPADEKSEESEVLQLPDEPENSEGDSSEIDDFLLDFASLYGTWQIWTPSTVVNISAPGSGEYIGHRHEEGADQGVIVINPDGSYTMSHAAWAADETVSGTWRLSYPREINGEVLQAIVLLDGITDSDWAVAPSPNRKIRLLWAMPWADGSATWVFDSELVRP